MKIYENLLKFHVEFAESLPKKVKLRQNSQTRLALSNEKVKSAGNLFIGALKQIELIKTQSEEKLKITQQSPIPDSPPIPEPPPLISESLDTPLSAIPPAPSNFFFRTRIFLEISFEFSWNFTDYKIALVQKLPDRVDMLSYGHSDFDYYEMFGECEAPYPKIY
jgi:hypothetical protein